MRLDAGTYPTSACVPVLTPRVTPLLFIRFLHRSRSPGSPPRTRPTRQSPHGPHRSDSAVPTIIEIHIHSGIINNTAAPDIRRSSPVPTRSTFSGIIRGISERRQSTPARLTLRPSAALALRVPPSHPQLRFALRPPSLRPDPRPSIGPVSLTRSFGSRTFAADACVFSCPSYSSVHCA